MSDMLDVLDHIYGNANRLVAGVGDKWEAQTPCSEWNVKQLVNHMTGTTKTMAASAGRAAPPEGDEHLGDDPVGSFAAAASGALAAWRADGALEGNVQIPLEMPAAAALSVNVLDIGTHVWDLATATGQDHGLSAEAVTAIDQANRMIVSDEVRSGGGFGEDLGAQGEDALANMLSFVGRKA